ALTFSAHTPKNGRGFRGSGAIGAKLDVLLDMRRPGTGTTAEPVDEYQDDLELDDGRRILEGRGRGVPHFVHRLSFDGRLYSLGEAPAPLLQRVFAAIPDSGATTRNIRERVTGRSERIGDALKKLEAAGRVRRTDDHWWRVNDGSQGGSRSHLEMVEE